MSKKLISEITFEGPYRSYVGMRIALNFVRPVTTCHRRFDTKTGGAGDFERTGDITTVEVYNLSMRRLWILLLTLIVYTSAMFGRTQPIDANCGPSIKETLTIVDELKPGDTRAKLERNFQLDGGLQFAAKSRYILKKCNYIKIDVELTGDGIENRIDFLPTDKILKVSKPYLEYPIDD